MKETCDVDVQITKSFRDKDCTDDSGIYSPDQVQSETSNGIYANFPKCPEENDNESKLEKYF